MPKLWISSLLALVEHAIPIAPFWVVVVAASSTATLRGATAGGEKEFCVSGDVLVVNPGRTIDQRKLPTPTNNAAHGALHV